WGPRAIGDHGAPVSFPTLKKAYKKGTRGISWSPLLTPGPQAKLSAHAQRHIQRLSLGNRQMQGRTDNSWGPPGSRGSWGPCVLAQMQKKANEKGTRGISWGPLLTPGPRTVPEFPNGLSA
ncbi:unnamed protein product, partial [Staurois parvus]